MQSRDSQESFPTPQLKSINFLALSFLHSPTLTSIHDHWKNYSLPVIYLWPNCGAGNEDNDDLLQKVPCIHCYTQCPQPCRRLLLTHASAGDFWGHLQASLVSLLWGHWSFLLGPGVHRFCLCPPRVSQSCVSSGSSMVGLMATSSKRAYAIPKSVAPRVPAPVAVHC